MVYGYKKPHELVNETTNSEVQPASIIGRRTKSGAGIPVGGCTWSSSEAPVVTCRRLPTTFCSIISVTPPLPARATATRTRSKGATTTVDRRGTSTTRYYVAMHEPV